MIASAVEIRTAFASSVHLSCPVVWASKIQSGGVVTPVGSVYFFLGVSVFSLILAALFSRQAIGSGIAFLCRRSRPPSSQGVKALLKRQYRTAAVPVVGLLLPTFAYAQREHAGGGEANLMLPDLSSVSFELLRHERTCPADDRIAVLRRRPVVRPDDLCAVEEPAGSSLACAKSPR